MTARDVSPNSGLPPRPDPATGYPRPPHAPLMVGKERRFAEREHLASTRVPSPPDGQGPVLEWSREPLRGRGRYAIPLPLIVVALAATIETRSVEWMTSWWPWAFVAALALFYYFSARPMMCAGADWYRCGSRFVRTYELVSATVSRTATGDVSWHLNLKDEAGCKTATRLDDLERNPLLWDLVYNGILHSVRNGAKTNRDSREYLSLRPERP